MKFNRDKGNIGTSTALKERLRADPVLSALYKADYVDIDDTVANNVDNTAFKKAMLRLAWIIIRKITR